MAQFKNLEKDIMDLHGLGYDATEIADLVEAIAPDEVEAVIDRCRDVMFDQMINEWLDHEPTLADE